jgi:bifunctional non-homologous end joining protein LigD
MDGFRILARRDSAGVHLFTRHGNDFTSRFPLAVDAVTRLPAHSFLLDGEAIVTNERGLAVFELIRRHRHGPYAVLIAFDLIERRLAACANRAAQTQTGKTGARASSRHCPQ